MPVVSYVAPSGARAASAGTYIMYASHVAAMAPGTNLGAATPIQIGAPGTPLPGQPDGAPDDDDAPEASHPGLADKAISDAIAYIRSLAQMRDRNVEWAEKAVREAASRSAADAAAINVIDLVADDIGDLLTKIDGRQVSLAVGEVTLSTTGLQVVTVEPDWRSRLLAVLTYPNMAYILMLVGIYGLIIEFYSPGIFLPGIVGAISPLLALYAFHVLPVNYAGLALLLLGIALMVSETFVPSFGVLGLGGTAAFVIGSIMLLDTDVPGYGISWSLIGGVGGASAICFMGIMYMLARARRQPVHTGAEEMLGTLGRIVAWADGEGHVRVHGELWRARSDRGLAPGGYVRIDKVDGLTLVVAPEPQGT